MRRLPVGRWTEARPPLLPVALGFAPDLEPEPAVGPGLLPALLVGPTELDPDPGPDPEGEEPPYRMRVNQM
jgi:hypothetical protein